MVSIAPSATKKIGTKVLDTVVPRGVQKAASLLTGLGSRERHYDANDAETQEMRRVWGPDMEKAFRANDCQSTPFDVSHFKALEKTIILPSLKGRVPLGTAAQVGGFEDATITDMGNGYAHFHIKNVMGRESLFNYYNIVGDRVGLPHIGNTDDATGPMSSVRETFDWYVRIEDLVK